jgi:hypothetical protein
VVDVVVATHREGAHLAADAARDEHGELALKRHEGFEHRGLARERRPRLHEIVARRELALALAVVAKAAVFSTAGRPSPQRRRRVRPHWRWL